MAAGARIRITRVLEPDELGDAIETAMRNLGNAMGARAQRLVPKRSFALHDTIETEVVRSGMRVSASVGAGGGDVDYALYVERGTSRMGAQPYLRPALYQTKPSDLKYSGAGPTRAGVRTSTSRERRRAR